MQEIDRTVKKLPRSLIRLIEFSSGAMNLRAEVNGHIMSSTLGKTRDVAVAAVIQRSCNYLIRGTIKSYRLLQNSS